MKQSKSTISLFAGLSALLSAATCQATLFHVAIDTSSLGSVTIGAAFDFLDGGTPFNSVVISNFATDGSLGIATLEGGILDSLPPGFTLLDTSFFNEYYQPITSSTSISFDFEATANAPDLGSLPDTFSFFLIDEATGLSLFDTTDPTGSGALFILEIDGSTNGLLSNYSATSTNTAVTWSVALGDDSGNSVPEPSTPFLFGAGLLGAAFLHRRHKSRHEPLLTS